MPDGHGRSLCRAELLRAVADVTTELSTKKELLAESAELNPSYATYLQLGEAYDAINDGTGALDAWRHALSLAPTSMQRFVTTRIERLQQKLAVEERFESRQAQHFVIAARMQQKRREALPSLALLARSFSRVSDRNEVRLRYDSAFDLVVELEQWRTARSFAEMFKLMTAGKRFEEAFDEVYGMNLEVFESRWRSYC